MTNGTVTLSGVTFAYSSDSTKFRINKDVTIYTAQGAVYSINDLAHNDYSANTNIPRVREQLMLIKLK